MKPKQAITEYLKGVKISKDDRNLIIDRFTEFYEGEEINDIFWRDSVENMLDAIVYLNKLK